ncbi:MAG: rRNA pseudouridine synthase [Oscillospiraceae bacterium]|nr:rRNA pseudouridine synthase [Oscillospiraceae bacterium]
MPLIRLDKLISDSGMYTRNESHVLVKSGRVSIAGCIAISPTEKVDPDIHEVKIDHKQLVYRKFVYIMMNKPQGFVSATEDRHEQTVIALLDEKYQKLGLFPAGRLDKDTEGFLLLTNDGDFAHRITSPNKHINKQYFAQIDGDVTDADIDLFSKGLKLADGTFCRPSVLERTDGGVYLTLSEGKYHQVKRMLAAIGKPVKYLKRISIGGLMLDDALKPGQYKEINACLDCIFSKK